MKHRHITIGSSLIAALLLAAVTRADAPASAPADQTNAPNYRQLAIDYAEKTAALEAEVTRLKNQVANLQVQLSKATRQPPLNFQIPPNGVAPMIPPNAVPHLFNGGIYYTIPVNAQPR